MTFGSEKMKCPECKNEMRIIYDKTQIREAGVCSTVFFCDVCYEAYVLDEEANEE